MVIMYLFVITYVIFMTILTYGPVCSPYKPCYFYAGLSLAFFAISFGFWNVIYTLIYVVADPKVANLGYGICICSYNAV